MKGLAVVTYRTATPQVITDHRLHIITTAILFTNLLSNIPYVRFLVRRIQIVPCEAG